MRCLCNEHATFEPERGFAMSFYLFSTVLVIAAYSAFLGASYVGVKAGEQSRQRLPHGRGRG
jgi:hypothetical protein